MAFSAHRQTLRFALKYWLLSPRLFGVMIAARLASNCFDVLIPLASGRLADTLVSESREIAPSLWALAGLIGLVTAFHGLRTFVTFAIIRVTTTAMEALARDAFARVQRFSSNWHANSFAGATVRKISRGMWGLDVLGDTLIFGIIPTAVVLFGVTVMLVWRWPALALIVFLGIAIYLALSVALSLYWIQPAGQIQQRLDSSVNARLADSISGNQVVKDFAAETREDTAFAALARQWRQAARVAWNRETTTNLWQTIVLIVMQAALVACGIYFWSLGHLSAGDIVSLLGVQGLLNAYLKEFGQHVRNVQRCVNDMEDVVAFDAAQPGVVDAPGASALRVHEGGVVFERVCFRYPKGNAWLYDDLSVTILPGERVGLVGASGAGKTTFVKLLQRYFDLEGGRILIDGQDIAQVTQASLRRSIGIVSQEPILFHRPLHENIAFGCPHASREQIRDAARRAHADMFIDALPDGYDTLVGERGVKLSGGERQRVAIARAILADTPILILDEATSSLDSVSERHIRAAIEDLSSGRTTLVVAHRLSTVQRLDRILVFDQGRIVEDGPHEELMRRPGGVYRKLFETQAHGEIAFDDRVEKIA